MHILKPYESLLHHLKLTKLQACTVCIDGCIVKGLFVNPTCFLAFSSEALIGPYVLTHHVSKCLPSHTL